MTPSLLVALLTTAPVAHAQDAFGVSPGAQSGGLLDAPTTSTARGLRPGTAAASLLVDHSLQPLQVCTEGAEIDPEYGTCAGRENTTPWLQSHTGLFLAGAYGLSPRLSLGGDAALRHRLPSASGVPACRKPTRPPRDRLGLWRGGPARPEPDPGGPAGQGTSALTETPPRATETCRPRGSTDPAPAVGVAGREPPRGPHGR